MKKKLLFFLDIQRIKGYYLYPKLLKLYVLKWATDGVTSMEQLLQIQYLQNW